jgi:hypothetical protein
MSQPFAAPAGYVWTGTVFARINPIPGDTANVLTVSQAAYTWDQPDPSQYLPPSTIPAPSQTPVYGMDAQGNIGPITDPRYAFSVDQAQAAAQIAAQQLMASGANPYLPPPTVTDSTGQTYVYDGPSNMPAPAPTTPPVVQTLTPPAYQPPTVFPSDDNEIPSDYLFPVGSTNNQSNSGAQPAPTGAVTMAFQFTQSAFADPAAYAYMARYPDVLAAFRANSFGMTPDVFARTHYERFGVPERRIWSSNPVTTAPPAGVGGGLLPIAAAVAALFFLG